MQDKSIHRCAIILDMTDFPEWLNEQLNIRGWSQAELARRAGVSRTSISDVLAYKHKAGYELCKAIAKALRVPPEIVFRRAGLLPERVEKTEIEERILVKIRKLPPDEQQRLLRYLDFLIDEHEKEKQPRSTKRLRAQNSGAAA